MSNLRMNAYYYSFEPTGNHAIDRVLSAVAEAGKSYHNTSEWTDDTDWQGNRQAPHPEFGGASCAEWIQNAANDAASRNCSRCEFYDANSSATEGVGYCTNPVGWHRARSMPPGESCTKYAAKGDQ